MIKSKPKVSMMVVCYNQENFIEESILSCLEQDYENLEIIISDDCSTDSTFIKVKKILERKNTNHKIILNRNKENLGIGRHFNHLMQNFVSGKLVVTCAGDDRFKVNRVSRIVEEWLNNNQPSLIAHSIQEINDQGQNIDSIRNFIYKHHNHGIHEISEYALLEYTKHLYYIPYIGAAAAYDAKLYNDFPKPIVHSDTEDHFMYFRALLRKGVHYFEEKLTEYRVHDDSFTQKEIKPLNINNDWLADVYKNNKNTIKPEFLNTYGLLKTRVQQWLDYLYAVKNFNLTLNFDITTNLYNTIIREHNILIRNISASKNIKVHLWHIKQNIVTSRSKKPVTELSYLPKVKTVIFGTGRGAKNILKKLPPCFDIIYACNTLGDYSKKSFANAKVINLEQLKKIDAQYDCILIASSKYFHIKKTLTESANIAPNKIIRIPALTISK